MPAGADMTLEDDFDKTALDYAKPKRNEEIITMLEAAAAAQ